MTYSMTRSHYKMDLQTKIDTYLAGDPKIPDDIVFRASQMFNSKLGKFNFKRKMVMVILYGI